MNRNTINREQGHTSMMIESLENRELMSATAGGFDAATSDYQNEPKPVLTALLLPAVQKQAATAGQTGGIIAILIGL